MTDTRDFIKFLGTAGARFAVARQVRASGGTYVCIGGRQVLLDPGPGALVRCAKSRPRIDVTKLDAVILTHGHIDHANDVNCIVDGMPSGGFERRGALFAPGECLEGPARIVLEYLREFPERIEALAPEREYAVDGLGFGTSVSHAHGCETYGIRFHKSQGDVSFVSDTAWFDGLPEAYAGSDVLVINVVRLRDTDGGRIKHLSVPLAERIIEQVQPRIAVITHFGMTMIKAKPWKVADEMGKRLGRPVIAAGDSMTLEL